MRHEVVTGGGDEAVAEFDSEFGVVRGPDGGMLACRELGKAFERELDGTIRGIRGGGAGAGGMHSGDVDELRRCERQYMTQMAAEVVSRLRSRGARHARVWTGKESGEGDARGVAVHALAWGRGGRVVGEAEVWLNGGVIDVLSRGAGRSFVATVCDAMWRTGKRCGVVIGE
jgi:hypothetical protein